MIRLNRGFTVSFKNLASLSDLIQAVPQFYLHSHFLIVLKRLRKSQITASVS